MTSQRCVAADDGTDYWIVKIDEFLFSGMREVAAVVLNCLGDPTDPGPEENRIYYDPHARHQLDTSTIVCRVSRSNLASLLQLREDWCN
jgi:hypothetical protein